MKAYGVSVVLLLIISLIFSPIIQGDLIDPHDRHNSIEETEYWAVIIGIADYDGLRNDLPISQKHLRMMYEVLVSKSNWQEDHIKLLLNEEATRDAILESLDWLHNTSDANDVVLFSFQGHGSSTEDYDGDEQDGRDEAIVSWEGLSGLITDDELDEKFDRINCSGMMLVFHSCLSGGLIDIFDPMMRLEIKTGFNDAFTTDIEDYNRVIVVSSLDQGLALAFPSLTRQMSYGFEGNADDDTAGDSGYLIISAEEAAVYGINQVKKLYLILLLLYPPVLISFLFASVLAKIQSGYWILPIPQFFDGYEGELSIVELT